MLAAGTGAGTKYVKATALPGVLLLEPPRFDDERGYFAEDYNLRAWREWGVECAFVQDNRSLSYEAGTIRGLHFQLPPMAQAKLVHCTRGAICDVAVDIRRESPWFGRWTAHVLDDENNHQLFMPIGIAHGFATLRPDTIVEYKCSDYYAPALERSIRWDDSALGIEWPPLAGAVINEKDRAAPAFAEADIPNSWSTEG